MAVDEGRSRKKRRMALENESCNQSKPVELPYGLNGGKARWSRSEPALVQGLPLEGPLVQSQLMIPSERASKKTDVQTSGRNKPLGPTKKQSFANTVGKGCSFPAKYRRHLDARVWCFLLRVACALKENQRETVPACRGDSSLCSLNVVVEYFKTNFSQTIEVSYYTPSHQHGTSQGVPSTKLILRASHTCHVSGRKGSKVDPILFNPGLFIGGVPGLSGDSDHFRRGQNHPTVISRG